MHSYSQFGEDKIIYNHFNKNIGYFVEVGANDPIAISQTYLFEQNGWLGALIEPLPHLAEHLRKMRPQSQVFECAATSPDKCGESYIYTGGNDTLASLSEETGGQRFLVKTRTMNDILEEAKLPSIDFLSMDVEGFEMDVFAGLDLQRWAPSLILIEDHVHDLEKHRYLVASNYKLINRLGCNNWYIPKSSIWHGPTHLSHFERIRKFYLGLPFRKLKLALKKVFDRKTTESS